MKQIFWSNLQVLFRYMSIFSIRVPSSLVNCDQKYFETRIMCLVFIWPCFVSDYLKCQPPLVLAFQSSTEDKDVSLLKTSSNRRRLWVRFVPSTWELQQFFIDKIYYLTIDPINNHNFVVGSARQGVHPCYAFLTGRSFCPILSS